MQYKQYTLDEFQIKAIESLENNHSVVVSAATGTGKTLIADYVINKYLPLGKHIIYTAPIKALSNQKFRDFCHDFGKEKVGLITGDVQYNQEAPLLIMTTEIYRNMLTTHDPILGNLAYVIFDEIHFISDIERGTIWEESIIFSPEHIRFLCLSATIPNAEQFAAWIQSIKNHPVDVVRYAHRAVPLTHLFYDEEGFGVMTRDELVNVQSVAKAPRYDRHKRNKDRAPRRQLSHISLINELEKNDWLPCLFFIFSRNMCMKKARELAKIKQYLPKNKGPRVLELYKQTVNEEESHLESARSIKELALHGIGVHHAGLLPKLKEFVELCFAEGLLAVLFATETFAVGINMPARAVCFLSLEKYDGMNFRYLNSKEYFQLAGRAGRRGIDTEGYAFSMFEMSKSDIPKILQFTEADKDPLISQFGLSFNTTLYLYHNYGIDEAEIVLKNSFDYYQKKTQGNHLRIMASYKNKIKILRQMGYLDDKGLTGRGEILQHIYSHELLMGEIFTTDIIDSLEPVEVVLLLAALELEERRGVHFTIDQRNPYPGRIMHKIEKNMYIAKNVNKFNLKRLAPLITRWMQPDAEFDDLLDLTSMQEGDIIHLFRRIMDALRQVRHAMPDSVIRMKLEACMAAIDKSPVRFEL